MKRTNYIKFFLSVLLYALVCGLVEYAHCQVIPPDPGQPPPVVEQQLENLAESSNDVVTEDDSYLLEMVHFVKEPLNLNYAGEGQLQELKLLSPLQISNLISYRNLLGNFINIYELQAIPGWDVTLLKRILPYVTVSTEVDVFNSIGSRLKNGENTLLIRGTQVLEKSRECLADSSVATNFYPGSPQKILVRYKYMFKNLCNMASPQRKMPVSNFLKEREKTGSIFIQPISSRGTSELLSLLL